MVSLRRHGLFENPGVEGGDVAPAARRVTGPGLADEGFGLEVAVAAQAAVDGGEGQVGLPRQIERTGMRSAIAWARSIARRALPAECPGRADSSAGIALNRSSRSA